MMKNQGEKLYGSTASGKVIPLFSHTDATSTSARWGHVDRPDDPFDALYISELRPDEVEKADIMAFLEHSDIVDLSDTISFVDEWED